MKFNFINSVLLNKFLQFLGSYAAIPGGIILSLGEPSDAYKQAILISYMFASVSLAIYAKRTNQTHIFISSLIWIIVELYGLFGKSLFSL